jgi:hypothetical protein
MFSAVRWEVETDCMSKVLLKLEAVQLVRMTKLEIVIVFTKTRI